MKNAFPANHSHALRKGLCWDMGTLIKILRSVRTDMTNLFFIKTFVCVAQTGSFRLAAEKNHITQPAVSQHIRSLEQRLNCVLLERSSKKVILTPAGQIFMTYALSILENYETARSKIADIDNQDTGMIHIVSIYTMGLYLLKPVMQHLLKKHPNINFQLEYVQHDAIYEIIKNGQADFGLVAFPKETPSCTYKVFLEESLVLVQSRKHPFFKSRTISLKDLTGIKFVSLGSQTPTGKAIHRFFENQGITLNVVKEDNNIETIKNSVDVGMGCAILPKSTVLQEVKNKTFNIITIRNFTITRPLAIIHNKKKVFGRSARLFYEMIHKNRFGQ